MLFLSEAKISIRSPSDVYVEGGWKRYETSIVHFLQDLGLSKGTIRLRFGRYVFSSSVDPEVHQQLRNFLVNECRIRK